MGGTGPGHKSERARRSRRVNIQKARAARKRAPLPWRSGVESRIIEQLVWQWFLEARQGGQARGCPSTGSGSTLRVERLKAGEEQRSGAWPAFAEATARRASGERKQKQIPRRNAPPFDCAQGRRNDNLHGWQTGAALPASGLTSSAPTKAKRPWAKYRVARLLGVSHTWVNKLVKRFEADPERMRRKMRAFAPASFEKLERAREETRRERERGLLREPIRWRRVKVTIEGKKRKVVAVTRAARLRQGYSAASPLDNRQGYGGASGQAGAAPVRYSELPEWAKGLLLPGDPGMATLPLSGQAGRGLGARTPRPVPFAFRRRR